MIKKLVLLLNLAVGLIATNSWATCPSGFTCYEVTTAGNNVGIGTTDLTNPLNVATGAAIGGTTYTQTAAPNNGLIVQGNVGVGLTNPVAPFQVSGGGNTGIGTVNPVGILQVVGGGNTGIGSTNPGQALDVAGTVRMTGFSLTTSPTNGYVLKTDGNGNGTWQISSGTPGGSTTQVQYNSSGSFAGNSGFIYNGTNVGIGSATPGQKLDVTGTIRSSLGAILNGSNGVTPAVSNPGVLNVNGGGIAGELVNKGYELAILQPPGAGGGVVEVSSLLVHKGYLYINYADTNKTLYKWDGNTLSLVETGVSITGNALASLEEYNGKMYMGTDGDAGTGSVYVSTDDGATWSVSYAPGTDFFMYALKTYKGKLYAGAGYNASRIYSYDGTTWSTAYAGLGAIPAGLVCDLYVYKGMLFGGIGNGGAHGGIVSSSDGSTFTQELNNVTVTRFKEFKGKLYAATQVSTPTPLYVRNDSDGTWSQVITFSGADQCWGIEVYNNALYVGCTVAGGGVIFKSFDGVTFTSDFINNTQGGMGTEPFRMINYNGSLYTGFGFTATGGDMWRKTDSLGQSVDWNNTFLNKFRQNTSNGYNWPNDASLISVTSPFSFDSNVGIGSVNPGKQLDVQGTVRALFFSGNGSGLTGVSTISGLTTNKVSKATSSTAIGDSQIFDNGTNVGISSTNPGKQLDIQGTARMLGFTLTTGAANGDLLQSDANGNSSWTNAVPALIDAQTGTSYTIIASDQGKLVTLSNSSPIAVTLPQATGSFTTGWSVTLEDIGAGTVTLTPTTSTIDGASSVTIKTNQGISIVSDGTNYSTFRGMGLGSVTSVGVSSPNSTLTIGSTPVTTSGTITADINLATANTWTGLQNFTTANVGIGSATPGQKLDVQGTVRVSQTFIATGIASDAGLTDTTVCQDTTLHKFSSGSGTLGICLGTSTVEAKQNIVPIKQGLDQIMSLKPITFNYKEGWGYDSNKSYYGFLAEDMVNILPMLVGHDKEGRIRSADYMGMIPVMVKAIQQLEYEIEGIKEKDKK